MNRMLSALSLALLSIAAAAQTPAPAITQGQIESADGNFYGIATAAA